MVLVQFAVDGEGQYLGTTKNTPASMHHTMRDLWKLLVHDGVITQVRTKVPLSLLSLPPSPPPPTHTHPQHLNMTSVVLQGPLVLSSGTISTGRRKWALLCNYLASHYWLFSGSRISGVR